MRTRFTVCFATLALVTTAACGGDKEPARDPSSSTMTTTPATPPPAEVQATKEPVMTTPQSEPVGQGTGQNKPADKALTDNQIATVTIAANEGEVQMAELAKKSATHADVKQFAAMMQTHHTKALDKSKVLQTKAKLPSEESDVSSKLKTDVSNVLSDLKDKKGPDFDKAYIESQVKAHRDVLDAIDNKMMPNAQNGELKTHLTEMRKTVADHLTKAEEIQKKLAGAKPEDKTKSTKTDTMGNAAAPSKPK